MSPLAPTTSGWSTRLFCRSCPQSGHRSPVPPLPPMAALGLPLAHSCPVRGTSSATRGTGEGTRPCPSCSKHREHSRAETAQTLRGCSHSQTDQAAGAAPSSGRGDRTPALLAPGGHTAVTGSWGTAWPRTSPTRLILPLGVSRGRALNWDHPSPASALWHIHNVEQHPGHAMDWEMTMKTSSLCPIWGPYSPSPGHGWGLRRGQAASSPPAAPGRASV